MQPPTNWSGLDLAPFGGHRITTGGQRKYKVAFLEPRRPPGDPHTRAGPPTACVHMRAMVGLVAYKLPHARIVTSGMRFDHGGRKMPTVVKRSTNVHFLFPCALPALHTPVRIPHTLHAYT
eukprot:2504658-Prymnesium_polylepis.1